MAADFSAFAPLLAPAFTAWGVPVSVAEVIALLLTLAMVACNMRVHPAGWPLAMASSALYALVFAGSKLYGEAGLQFIFIAIAAWGWWKWLRGDSGQPLVVARLQPRAAWACVAFTVVAWLGLGTFLRQHTDSDVPWLDALPTAASITAQWLLARKVIENWPLWVAVNVFSVGLFAYKALWLTAGLYGLLAVLAWMGWRAWRALLGRSHA